MSIEKINFTSSLLVKNPAATTAQNAVAAQQIVEAPQQNVTQNTEPDKKDIAEQNPNKNQSAEQAQTTEQPKQVEETQPQETVAADAPEKKSHTARNTVAVLAGLALVTLGVIKGREGKLGPRFQKILGGAEKAAEKDKINSKNADGLADDIIPKEEHLETHTAEVKEKTPVAEVKEETPVAEVKEETPVAEVKEEPPVTEVKEETPVAEVKEEPPVTEVKEEPPAEEVKVEAPKPAVDEAVSKSGKKLSKAEMEEIDKTLDKTLPKIEKEMLSVKAQTMDEVKAMGFDLEKLGFEMTGEPKSEGVKIIGDKKYFVKYDKEGNLSFIYQGSKDTEYYYRCKDKVQIWKGKICNYTKKTDAGEYEYWFDSDGTYDFATKEQGNYEYRYDEKGLLKGLTVRDENGKASKYIEYIPGKDKPIGVTYLNRKYSNYYSSDAIKIEVFDGKDYPVKEIYVKDGEKYEISRKPQVNSETPVAAEVKETPVVKEPEVEKPEVKGNETPVNTNMEQTIAQTNSVNKTRQKTASKSRYVKPEIIFDVPENSIYARIGRHVYEGVGVETSNKYVFVPSMKELIGDFADIKPSEIVLDKYGTCEKLMPNGDILEIFMTKDRKNFRSIRRSNRRDETVANISYENGKVSTISLPKEKRSYVFDENGTILSASEIDAQGVEHTYFEQV